MNRRRTRLLALLTAALCLGVQPAAGDVDPHAPGVFENLRAQLEQMRQQENVPAMGLALFDGGRPVSVSASGSADTDTPFRWGSITKSVTGLAALQLIRRTPVEADTPIRTLLGDGYYVNDFAPEHPVRFGELLTLSAGFTDLSRAEWADTEAHDLWQALNRFVSSRRTLWPPGLQHSYSNVPPGLTAAVIEKASGQPFEAFVRRHVFEPLGMQAASLMPVEDLPGGYQADGRTRIPYWHVTFRGFGALNASTNEMSRLVQALLNNGVLDARQALPADLIESFFSPSGTLASQAGLQVGYGSGVYGWVSNGHHFHGHGGDADGYRSRYGLLRDHGRGYLLVINTDNPGLLGRMRRHIEQALTADLPQHQPPSRAQEPLASFTGLYYPSTARFGRDAWRRGESEYARVEIAGEQLLFRRGRRSERLTPAGEGRFFREADPAISVVFVRDPGGSLFLQGELGEFVRTSPGPCPDFLKLCE